MRQSIELDTLRVVVLTPRKHALIQIPSTNHKTRQHVPSPRPNDGLATPAEIIQRCKVSHDEKPIPSLLPACHNAAGICPARPAGHPPILQSAR